MVGEVHEAGQLLARVADHCPDVVLLGWELPGARDGDLLAALRSACPDLCVVALSGRADARQAALDAGADAFVSKVAPPERLLSAIWNLGQRKSKERRSTMVEVEKRERLKYVAIIAAAVVLLVCVAAGLTVALVLISEIPFQHLFPH